MIAFADSLDGFRDEDALLVAVLDRVKSEAKALFGWNGFFIIDVSWIREAGRPPVCGIQLGPGQRNVTVEDVYRWINDRRERLL